MQKDQESDEVRRLKMTLKIPRLHLEYLTHKGALEHFVKAELTGTTAEAKWLLKQTGKDDIEAIEDYNLRNKKAREK